MYVPVCVFKIFPETTGPSEAKFHVEPTCDRRGKFIQMILVICCSSFEYWQPLGQGLFAGLLPQMWPRSAGLLAGPWKVKSPAIPRPRGDQGYK